jgi:hypothetical protein
MQTSSSAIGLGRFSSRLPCSGMIQRRSWCQLASRVDVGPLTAVASIRRPASLHFNPSVRSTMEVATATLGVELPIGAGSRCSQKPANAMSRSVVSRSVVRVGRAAEEATEQIDMLLRRTRHDLLGWLLAKDEPSLPLGKPLGVLGPAIYLS